MTSPFENLPLDRALVCEFFAIFSRFEYALKETGFCVAGRYGAAMPNWIGFQERIGTKLSSYDNIEVKRAIRFLTANPPQVQKVEEGRAVFQADDLRGDNDGERAIEATRRVRNNLFHGGKHTPHSPPWLFLPIPSSTPTPAANPRIWALSPVAESGRSVRLTWLPRTKMH